MEVKGWLRALEIAKILFEDQGYHRIYLNQIDRFIRRTHMYSPKIKEEFIPVLFRIALSKKIPMTKLVNRIIGDYLEKNGEMEREEEGLAGGRELQRRGEEDSVPRVVAPLEDPGLGIQGIELAVIGSKLLDSRVIRMRTFI